MPTTDNSTTAAPVKVVELGHIVLYVRDLDRSIAFYRDLLGWPVVAPPGQGPFRAAGFRAGDTHHDLLLIEVGPDAEPIPGGRRVGLYHFGVKMGDTDDELRAVRDKLLSRPDLTTIVSATDHGLTHSLYAVDPDGNELELYIDVQGVDWNDTSIFATMQPLQL